MTSSEIESGDPKELSDVPIDVMDEVSPTST